jgi:hypothetical protein
VGYIVGSLATASINRTLAKALIRLAPPELEFVEIPIKDLPLYSYDYDADYPAEGRALKDALASVDAVLLVTPEYNRSIPGGLKNAIDLGEPPARAELVRRQALGSDRRVPGQARDCTCSTQPAPRVGLLQLSPDEHPGGVHPRHTRNGNRRRGGHRCQHGALLAEVHGGVPDAHCSGAHPCAISKC